jgi:hypothetical protein
MSRIHPRRATVLLAATVLPLALGLAACGDDDEAVSAEACDAYALMPSMFFGDPAAAGDTLDSLVAALPDDLKDDGEAVASAIETSFSDESSDAMSSEEYLDANERLGEAMVDGCDTESTIEVDGVDYAFEGLPAELPAGRTAITFTNATQMDEAHELVVVKRNDGVDDSIADLLALPEEELFSKITPTGLVFVEQPERSAVAMLDLEAGRYIAICMIPTGGEGPPHAMEGMTAEFTVV